MKLFFEDLLLLILLGHTTNGAFNSNPFNPNCLVSNINVPETSANPRQFCNFNIISYQYIKEDYFPILFFSEGNLLYPTNSQENATLPPDALLILFIPSSQVGIMVTTLKCFEDTRFMSNDPDDSVLYNIHDYYADKLIFGWDVLEEVECQKDSNYISVIFSLGQAGGQEYLYQSLIYKSCFNTTELRVNYVNHIIKPFKYQTASRPDFKDGSLGKYNLEFHYGAGSQLDKLSKILGAEKANQLVYNKNGGTIDYLSRGHLAAMTDFVFAQQQYSSFYHANVAPQWQSFNQGAWKSLEILIRQTSIEQKRDLNVFTGTLDVLTMQNATGQWVKLYLGPNQTIPVPLYFYKIVREFNVSYIGKNFIQTTGVNFHELMPQVADLCTRNLNRYAVNNNLIYTCTLPSFLNVLHRTYGYNINNLFR